MVLRDPTDMGGTADRFLTTHWSLIEGVQKQQDPDRAMIGLLLQQYWKPVYCYLRRSGYDNEQAKDLTQGFFHEVVLGRHLVQRADPSKGRFRAFLLHALKQYVIDTQRRQTTQRHIPPEKLVPLDAVDPPAQIEAMSTLDAEGSFNYAWKADLLDRVLAEVRARYSRPGMEGHWGVFQDRLVGPIMSDSPPAPYAEICRKYGIENEAMAANMLKTAKRLFRSLLEKQVRHTVAGGEAVEEEVREIFGFLQSKRTG
jgi:DNA-directed RNA polymerase specialized sigma24 family protein